MSKEVEDEEVECNTCGYLMDLLPDNSIYVCNNSECTSFYDEIDESIMSEEEVKKIICRDKFDRIIKEGYYVDVQQSGIHKVYTKKDGQLYFTPYGKEEMVSSYFSNDLILTTIGSKLIMDLKKEIKDKKQQTLEETKKMYSEEEVEKIFNIGQMTKAYGDYKSYTFKEALELFKKK